MLVDTFVCNHWIREMQDYQCWHAGAVGCSAVTRSQELSSLQCLWPHDNVSIVFDDEGREVFPILISKQSEFDGDPVHDVGDVNVMLIELQMHKVCHRAAIRLATLPISHPLHKPVQICTRWQVKCHLSPIHLLLRAYNIDPSKFEMIALASRPPNHKYIVPFEIASSREESKEADTDDKATFKVYTDGSRQDGMAGAAAVLYKGHTLVGLLHYHLGSLERHTTYEAELIGILLGLWLIR